MGGSKKVKWLWRNTWMDPFPDICLLLTKGSLLPKARVLVWIILIQTILVWISIPKWIIVQFNLFVFYWGGINLRRAPEKDTRPNPFKLAWITRPSAIKKGCPGRLIRAADIKKGRGLSKKSVGCQKRPWRLSWTSSTCHRHLKRLLVGKKVRGS